MGFMSKMEDGLEGIFEGGAQAVFKQSLNPVQITKRAVKEMNRNKLVGSGRQYAPTLYNVLVSPVDDKKLVGFYPTLAREIETYLTGRAQENGMEMDGSPLVRFIVDDTLKKGKFDVVAENVASPIVKKLRAEEMFRYGLGPDPSSATAEPAPSYRRRQASYASQNDRPARHERPARQAARYNSNPGQAWADEEFPPFDDSPAPAPMAGSGLGGGGGASAQLTDVSTGEVYEVHSGGCTLGREEGCEVRILDANVSRRHASLDYGTNGWWIEDLNSTNGTQINHHRISRAPLRSGDVLTVGVTKLQFQER